MISAMFCRRSLLAISVMGSLWVLSGCALPAPGPRTLEVSEARLVERIAVQFPVKRRFMDALELSLDNPRVRLNTEENRIGTELDYVLGVAGRPSSRGVRGKLALSFGLLINTQDQTVRLHEVRVDTFDVPGLPPAMGQHASRMGGLLAEDLLRDFVVYRIRPEDLKAAGRWGYEPGPVTVVPGGLQVRLDPVQSN
ncbi:MAG: hypothetical protein C0453_01980 [Comamonadaceae bacterium]|nr:hypothetical protein [Comamonadaceae bacterium]